MNSRIIVQFLFFALSFYGLGAGFMDSFVIYHGWKFVGVSEFPVVHEEMGSRIIRFLVLPTLLMTILTIMMFWKRPYNIPRSWVLAAFLFEMISWVSSALIQIPIQGQLHVKDEAALQRLITTDWIRIVAWVGYIFMVGKMLWVVLKGNSGVKA